MIHELLISFRDINEIKEIHPQQPYRVEWEGKPLPDSTLAGSLPVLGMIVENNSDQDAAVYINGNRGKSFDVGKGGRERTISGFTISDIEIDNLGDAPIPRGSVKLTIFNDHGSMIDYFQLKALEKVTGNVGDITSINTVGGSY